MSCSMTIDAVRERSKTVTRRHVDTWKNLKPLDRLTLIEKGMGLPKGTKQVVLAEVVVVDVRVEPLGQIYIEKHGVAREGLSPMSPDEFFQFWCRSHGARFDEPDDVWCRRIEWRYTEPA